MGPMGDSGPMTVGVLAALEEELGELNAMGGPRRAAHGLEFLELRVGGVRVLACVSGVGKVAAARAATALVHQGPLRALLVVGVAGGLVPWARAGTLVHCTTAVQADLAVRESRRAETDEHLRRLWREVAPGQEGWYLTSDRPVLSPWRRLRLARAFAAGAVCDMETAAVGAVAEGCGVPWAALRAVTDRAGLGAAAEFRRNFRAQAGRAAATLGPLLERLSG